MSIRYPTWPFWLLFASGTILLAWSLLFAQTPSKDRLPDLIQFSGSTALLIAAVAVGFRMRRAADSNRIGIAIGLFTLLFEMLLSLYGVWGSATHLHSL